MNMGFRLLLRQRCSVCLRFIDEDSEDARGLAIDVALYGAASALVICPCCGQRPPKWKAKTYQKRAIAWLKDQQEKEPETT